MREALALLAVLRQSADAGCVAAIERLVAEAPDYQLSRINVLDFACRHGLDEERMIAAFLHAARIGLFECRGTCCARVAAACSTPMPR